MFEGHGRPRGRGASRRQSSSRACRRNSAAAAPMARTDATNGVAGGDRANGQRGTAHVATFRFGKVQPSSPSACRAAASRSSRHAA